jgi:CCR4-NOT transcriptional regulation complex NOT5 subunit
MTCSLQGRKDTTLIEALERKIERHRFHSDSLEKVLRMLDNETLSVDKVAEIRDGVEYYIESNNVPLASDIRNISTSIQNLYTGSPASWISCVSFIFPSFQGHSITR